MLRVLLEKKSVQFRTFLRERIRSIVDWSRGHPVRALLYGLCLILALEYLSLPNIRLQELEKVNPHRTALMKQREREASEAGKPFHEQQQWVPLNRISPHLAHAVIVSEDGTFYENGGVDWYEVEESIEKNLEEGKASRGASTISQQLAKNLFLSTSKDPLRKLKELVITLRMERVLSKERILEIYLNVIEWGNGVFGAEAAAKKYFGKSASTITREEAARLAAVIPSPLRHQPNQPSKYVERRASLILERMTARGY
jgi:monofunctional biosynthetic peptidoglycan transglycosylase